MQRPIWPAYPVVQESRRCKAGIDGFRLNVYLSPMLRCLLFLSCLFLFTSCFSQKSGTKKKSSRPARLAYGMTHTEVLEAVTDRSELLVGEATLPEGKMEAYQYARYGRAGVTASKFFLYFLNDTLFRRSEPEDVSQGFKLALKDRQAYYDQLEDTRAAQEARKAAEEAREAKKREKAEEAAQKAERRKESKAEAETGEGKEQRKKRLFRKDRRQKAAPEAAE